MKKKDVEIWDRLIKSARFAWFDRELARVFFPHKFKRKIDWFKRGRDSAQN